MFRKSTTGISDPGYGVLLLKTGLSKKILIIKTSSLGDVIHTLPALSDAQTAQGDVQFDWVVEENFAEIPAWHPAVAQVIPVAIRRWRKNIFKTIRSGEWKNFKQMIQQHHYDAVIDAQGLLKSAWLTRLARGRTYGLDKNSARESLAAYFYQYPQSIDKNMHAVERVRSLFAKSLNYSLKDLPLDYGLNKSIPLLSLTDSEVKKGEEKSASTILFLHGTTWDTKHWPETYWCELANLLTEHSSHIVLPWGNKIEYQRALKIKNDNKNPQQVRVLEKMNLNELAREIIQVDAVVAVDTGLAHLSAAFDKPTIAIYGPTSPGLTGTYGQNQYHLKTNLECSPCFKKNCAKASHNINLECYTDITPENVMNTLQQIENL